MKDKKVYRSNIGIMYFLVSVVILGVLIGLFLYARGDENTVVIFVAFIIAIIIYCFVLIYPVINTKYILDTDRLVIKCGLYKNEIAIRDIIEVYKKTSLGRYPALNEKMVFIKYINHGVTNLVGVSPKNQDGFIHEIQKKIHN